MSHFHWTGNSGIFFHWTGNSDRYLHWTGNRYFQTLVCCVLSKTQCWPGPQRFTGDSVNVNHSPIPPLPYFPVEELQQFPHLSHTVSQLTPAAWQTSRIISFVKPIVNPSLSLQRQRRQTEVRNDRHKVWKQGFLFWNWGKGMALTSSCALPSRVQQRWWMTVCHCLTRNHQSAQSLGELPGFPQFPGSDWPAEQNESQIELARVVIRSKNENKFFARSTGHSKRLPNSN